MLHEFGNIPREAGVVKHIFVSLSLLCLRKMNVIMNDIEANLMYILFWRSKVGLSEFENILKNVGAIRAIFLDLIFQLSFSNKDSSLQMLSVPNHTFSSAWLNSYISHRNMALMVIFINKFMIFVCKANFCCDFVCCEIFNWRGEGA